MTKYVIGPDVAIRLAHDQVAMGDEHQILAPALLRSRERAPEFGHYERVGDRKTTASTITQVNV